jgi:hypothetical protein
MYRKYAYSLLLSLSLAAASYAQNLVDSGQDLPGVWAGDAAWGDYDNDGDLDLALIGEAIENDDGLRIARIYGNEEALLFEDQVAGQQLVGAYHGALAWGDYDNDGDLDLAIAGWDALNTESLRLYRNDLSSGVLALDRLQTDANGDDSLQGMRYAALAWGDFDNDGDLDLVVSGMETNGTSQTLLYLNTGGVLRRDETNSETLVNLHNGDLAWGDYDGDGDLDLAVSGENVTTTGGLNAVSEFYKNDPPGTLELDTTIDGTNAKGGSLAWGDYDGDGNLDLAASGRPFGLFDGSDWTANITLYRNRPAGLLSADASFNLGATFRVVGDLAWVDYDNDGDIDLATTGRSILSTYQAFVFTNQSGSLSGVSTETLLQGLSGGSVDWVDYDSDGRADLLLSGSDASGQRHTVLYSNQGVSALNNAPTAPQNLNQPTVTSNRVLFSWSAGSDVEGDQLTYNLRVGSEPGGSEIFSGIAPNGPGNVGFKTNKSLLRSLAPDQYYWSVQSVDAIFARSEWSQEQILNIQQFVSSDQRIRALQQSAIAWGDADGDGDLDLAIAGQNRSGEAQTLFYDNDSGTLTTSAQTDLAAIRGGDISWGDYDNDGDLDLTLTGEDTFGNRRALLYALQDGNFSLIGQFPDLSESSADWGDYDNDGDLDLALSGQSNDILDGRQQSYTRVYNNDGDGSFNAADLELIGLNNGEIIWGDYDNDGDLDLAASGLSTSSERQLLLYINEGALLTESGLNLAGLESSDLAWGDYDGDGDLDLAAGGISDTGLRTDVYANDGNGGFEALADASFAGIKGGDLAWGDYDNDRDLDLVVAGNDGNGAILHLYENTQGRVGADTPFTLDTITLQGLDFSAVSLADIDGDGDLDLVSSGSTGGFDPLPLTLVNDNLESQFNGNLPPTTPLIIAATDAGSNVLFSWDAATDDGEDTPQSMSYNLRVGTSPDGDEVLSGTTALGVGNAGHNLNHSLHDLVSGMYYWSVQTIDDGFAHSDWSEARSFIIDTIAPELQNLSLSRSQLGIGQTATLALSFFDAHIGVDAASTPQVEAVGNGNRFAFSALQFTGATWSGELTIEGEMPSGTYAIEISGIVDAKGNAMPAFVQEAAFIVDTDLPTVISSSPDLGATGVSISTNELLISFSEPLDPATVNPDNFEFELGSRAVVTDIPEPQYIAASNSVRFFPIGDLMQPGSHYKVEVSAAIQDVAGNRPDNATVVSFETRIPAVVSVAPIEGDSLVVPGVAQITALYDSPILPELDDIQVFREGRLEPLRNIPIYDADNFSLLIEPAAGLKPGARYEVLLPSILSGPLGAQAAGDYRWSFQTRTPNLESTTPSAGGEIGADANTLSAVFDITIDADLIAENVTALKSGQSVAVDNLDYNADTRTLRFAIAEGLRAGTSYQVRIGASVGGPLRQRDYVFDFSTAIPLLQSSLPESDAVDVDVNFDELTLQFSAPVDSEQLNADNFTLSQLGQAVELRSGDPVARGDNTYGIAPAAGWNIGTHYEVQIAPAVSGPLGSGQTQTLNFTTDVPALTSTNPAADDTTITDIGTTISARFDAAIDEETLRQEGGVTLLQGGITIAITTPAYDPTTGTLSFNATQSLLPGNAYSVHISSGVGGPLQTNDAAYQWDFSTRVPSPISIIPAPDAVVTTGPQRLQVAFSGPLDPAAVNNQNFSLRQGATIVSLANDQFTYDAETFTVSFPSVDLRSGTAYSANVQAQASGPLASAISLDDLAWSFTTEVPRVLSTVPAAGEDGIGLAAATVQITFSDPVARQNVNDFRVSSRPLDDPQAAEELVRLAGFGADTTGTSINFTVEGGLKPFTEYRIEMVRQVLGPLAEEGFNWTFRTATSLADARQGGSIRNASGTIEVYFPPNSLPAGSGEISIRRLPTTNAAGKLAQETTQVAAAYSVSAAVDVLQKRATLTMRYSDEEVAERDVSRLAIFRHNDDQWQRIGGSVDANGKLVRTTVEQLGTFAIFEDLSTAVGTLSIRNLDCQPRAFAPKGGSLRSETDISFDLSGPSDVTVRVYNSAGRLERVIVRDEPLAPGRVSFKWDGLDEDRQTVASGLYIVVVNAGGQRREKTVAVVK